MSVLRKTKMLFSEIPIWIGAEEVRPGDQILVDLGRMLGERQVEYAGVYSEPVSGVRGLLGRLDGKILPLGSLSIYKKKIDEEVVYDPGI